LLAACAGVEVRAGPKKRSRFMGGGLVDNDFDAETLRR
jgi:hypothetical protein